MHPLVSAILAAGGGANSLLINPGSQSYAHINPNATATSGIRIATDRDVDEQQGSGVYADRGDWLRASGTASDYEVRFTLSTGTLNVGSDSTGSYLALSSSREWYAESTGVGGATGTVSIRHATRTSDEISFSVSLSVDGTPI